MASPPPRTTTALQWIVRTIRLGGHPAPIARICLDVHLPVAAPNAPRISESAWLDTGAPLSVIPFRVHRMGLRWQPLAGVRTTWFGQPCDVGHIEVWLSDLVSSSLRGPFTLLAKFLHGDPPGTLPPVLLGLEFLLTHQAVCTLEPPPRQGILRIP